MEFGGEDLLAAPVGNGAEGGAPKSADGGLRNGGFSAGNYGDRISSSHRRITAKRPNHDGEGQLPESKHEWTLPGDDIVILAICEEEGHMVYSECNEAIAAIQAEHLLPRSV